ncbi:hypothetical protein AAZX31_14G179300 [Glycine max]
MLHITTCSSVPLSVILPILFPTTLTLDLHDRTTRCDSCNSSSGTMSTEDLLDLPSARTKLLKFTRIWEILVMMRISCRPRSPSTGMLSVKEILEGEMLSSKEEYNSLGDESDPS